MSIEIEVLFMANIKKITGRQIYDSRGNPTVEVDIILDDDSFGRSLVPSGASTGAHEAYELRDGGSELFGKGVTKAVENINNEINNSLVGMDSGDQSLIDTRLIELDGTKNKSRLGANAVLGVSMANAKASSDLSLIHI